MKSSLIFILFLLNLSFALFSQETNYATIKNQFFKVAHTPTPSDPLWIQLLYADNPNFEEVIAAYEDYFSSNPKTKTIHTQNFKHWAKLVQPYVQADGSIRIPNDDERLQQEQLMREQRADNNDNRADLWTDVGPARTYVNNGSLNQRPTQVNIYCLGIAPSNHNIMYCAGETGGVFKSTNKAQSWTHASKSENFTNAQDIKVHPTNPDIVYVAVGQHVYKSTNGANTWSIVHSFGNNVTVEQFYIHRVNHNHIYAATSSGLHLSTNGGSTWTQLMAGRFWDIEAHTVNPDIIYVSRRNSTLNRAEIFKSTDAGINWTLKDNQWYMPTNSAQAQDIGCKIALTPADPERVYCGLIGQSKPGDAGWIGVYYSLNGGDSWVNPTGSDGGPYVSGSNMNTNWYVAGYYDSSGDHYHQGWYNFDLVASDVNPDRIWLGTIWFCESNNRGGNFEYVRDTRNLEMHADIQDMEVVDGELWVASDGGLNYSTDESQTMMIRNNGVTSSDFWGFDHGWNEDTYVGGRYHNGDAVYHENYGIGNSLFLGGAEEATGYINQLNNRETHFSDITDKITPDDLTLIANNTFNYAIYPNESYTWMNSSEVHCDPRYANHLYLGRDNIFYKSTSGGTVFSPLFTFPTGTRVLEFEIGRDNPNVIYCVVRSNTTCLIYKSTDGGNNFEALPTIPASMSRVDISLNPSNSEQLWVNCRFGANGSKIFMTTDGGATWQNKTTAALDGNNFLDILYQGGTSNMVYIVSINNVFQWNESSNNWVNYSADLPFVINPLHFRPFYRDKKLRLSSTRGIWEAAMAAESAPIAQPMAFNDKIYCSRDTVQLDCYSILHHDNATWQWSISPQPQYVNSLNIRNPKVILGGDGFYSVTLTVTDGNGLSSTKTVQNMLQMIDNCSPDTIPGLAMRSVSNGDYANVPDLGLSNVNKFTISAWIKPDGSQDEYTGIVMSDGPACGLNFRPNMQLAYHWPGGQWWWNSGLTFPADVWSHVAMVVSPNSITVYLNGVASTHNITPQMANINTMKIGSYQGWGGRNFRGEIDEVCIWNRSLTQNEIRELRHLTRTGPQPYTNDLVAYYQFNLPNTVIINDRVGLNHASLNGAAQKVTSSAPVGGGVSDRLTVSGSGSITFPNTQTTMTLPQASTWAGEVVVSRLHVDPNFSPSVNSNMNLYWIVNNYGNQPNLPLENITFTSHFIPPTGPVAQMQLSQRTENQHLNNWANLCTASSSTGNSIQFGNACNINNFGQFAISSEDFTALSIDLHSFDGNCDINSVLLNWITSSELNSAYFEVERSDNGFTWQKVGHVQANGTTITTSFYEFEDSYHRGLIYYRLTEIDLDGVKTTYPPISLNCLLDENSVKIYPNPNNGIFHVSLPKQLSYNIDIVDLTGKSIQTIQHAQNHVSIFLNNEASGVYLLRITDANGNTSFGRIVKQ